MVHVRLPQTLASKQVCECPMASGCEWLRYVFDDGQVQIIKIAHAPQVCACLSEQSYSWIGRL